MKTPEGFFAYPSQPPDISETIITAITELNQSGCSHLSSWQSLSLANNLVNTAVLQAIAKTDFFCADLTTNNMNVLFELGYAIGLGKHTWLIKDNSRSTATPELHALPLFRPLGYSEYTKSAMIVSAYYKDQPWKTASPTFYDTYLAPARSYPEKPLLFYMKTPIDTEASTALTEVLRDAVLSVKTDDPTEISKQPFEWYARALVPSVAAVIHFQPTDRPQHHVHNCKCAFIGGLAIGLGKPVLLLAQDPAPTPMDLVSFLKIYPLARTCRELAHEFLEDVSRARNVQLQKATSIAQEAHAVNSLQLLSFGEEQAENEESELPRYFVPTASYTAALNARQLLFIGRKGAGKTANLFQIAHTLRQKRGVFVCDIRPVDYDLEGVVLLLRQVSERAERGFLLESLWRFLIVTELAWHVRREFEARPPYIPHTKEQADFLAFAAENRDILHASFAVRLEAALGRLAEVRRSGNSIAETRLHFSEALHRAAIEKVRAALGPALAGYERVVVLFDNLDKAWTRGADLEFVSEFLLGLLRAQRPIVDEFGRHDAWRRSVAVSLVVFLRSDMYYRIVAQSREPDKLQHEIIRWDDPELLLRVLEERFVALAGEDSYTPTDFWAQYVCDTVRGVPVREFIVQSVLPRPRDILVLATAALANAKNRKHKRIEETDWEDALSQYSEHAFEALVAEHRPCWTHFESAMYEFAGADETLVESEISAMLSRGGIDVQDITECVEALVTGGFLGLEIRSDQFRFLNDDGATRTMRTMAERFATLSGCEMRYRIHRAYWRHLQIDASK